MVPGMGVRNSPCTWGHCKLFSKLRSRQARHARRWYFQCGVCSQTRLPFAGQGLFVTFIRGSAASETADPSVRNAFWLSFLQTAPCRFGIGKPQYRPPLSKIRASARLAFGGGGIPEGHHCARARRNSLRLSGRGSMPSGPRLTDPHPDRGLKGKLFPFARNGSEPVTGQGGGWCLRRGTAVGTLRL